MQKSDIKFPVTKVPGSDIPVRISSIEINAKTLHPVISVQPVWQGSSGIIRGVGEDFIDEVIVGGVRRKTTEKISGPSDMRKHVWTIKQHLENVEAIHPGAEFLGGVGNGNLLSNPWFTAFIRGVLYRVASEDEHIANREYTSLVVWTNSSEPRVTIEPLRYHLGSKGCRVIAAQRGIDVTDQIETATFGQQIVFNGRAKSKDQLNQMVLAGQFYDLRHPFLFGRHKVGTDSAGSDRWLDVGLAPLWNGDGTMNTEMLGRACAGEMIPVDISQFDKDRVVRALEEKGYTSNEYRLDHDTLDLRLRPGIYPHDLVGLTADGTILSVSISGASNRAGVTLEQAAEIMIMLGARDALILDNGNDVFAHVRGEFVAGSDANFQKRLRSVVFWKCMDAVRMTDDLRVTLYPVQ